MKKKGFTLIELLAVIVILAIIALILTPVISNIIDSARKSAFKRTVDGILTSAKYYTIESNFENINGGLEYPLEFVCDGISCKDENDNRLNFKGETPISGTVTINSEGLIEAHELCNKYFCSDGTLDGLVISGGSNQGIDETIHCDLNPGESWVFDYLDDTNENRYHTMNVPCKGYYKLEVWGAQGGTSYGGKGGYSAGDAMLSEGEQLYIVIGGTTENATGGYNGGGNGSNYYGGGGATHIATTLEGDGQLKNYETNKDKILIVAGGGGGGKYNETESYRYGGVGGGIIGGTAGGGGSQLGKGGTQTEGAPAASGSYCSSSTGTFGAGSAGCQYASGGGGGWYGGSGGARAGTDGAGGGGSGHIGLLSNTSILSGAQVMPTHDGADTMTGNASNGYAKITYLRSTVSENHTWSYIYTGDVQKFTALKSGKYKIELWGAQGGDYTQYTIGGKGAYTEGIVNLSFGNELYIYVGSQPTLAINSYNGGGDTNNTHYPTADGGGATDVRLAGGTWNDFDSLKSRIMVAAGGGGAEAYNSESAGAAAGGLIGYSGSYTGTLSNATLPTGGTQTTGGIKDTAENHGYDGGFGYGGNGDLAYGGGAGGSGYYGGGGGGNLYHVSSGAGGSSYISGHDGCDAISNLSTYDNIVHTGQSVHYSKYKFTDTIMIDGTGCKWTTEKTNECNGMPTHDGTSTMTGNTSNGYAKITYIGN